MGLYRLKRRFVRALRGAEDVLVARAISADALTLASLPIAAATATALIAGAAAPAWWLLVAPLSLLRMALNALDGAVARRTATAHARGAVLNELVDRAADLVTLAAGYLLPIPAPLVSGAIVATLAASFVAVTAQAVTGVRLHAGPMGKPDRVLVLSVAAGAAVAVGPAALTSGFAVIAAFGTVTVIRRAVHLWADAAVVDGAEGPTTTPVVPASEPEALRA